MWGIKCWGRFVSPFLYWLWNSGKFEIRNDLSSEALQHCWVSNACNKMLFIWNGNICWHFWGDKEKGNYSLCLFYPPNWTGDLVDVCLIKKETFSVICSRYQAWFVLAFLFYQIWFISWLIFCFDLNLLIAISSTILSVSFFSYIISIKTVLLAKYFFISSI